MSDILQSRPRHVICAFYASTTYGSEYRAGMEFIRFAASMGFDHAIVADLDENSSRQVLEQEAPGIRVIRVSSPIKKQSSLYRYSDIIAQTVWHMRVARLLRDYPEKPETLWIQNGASPWLPLAVYFKLCKVLVWGPVGGGEPPPPAMLKKLPLLVRIREYSRSFAERRMLAGKVKAMGRSHIARVVAIARTSEAKRLLEGSIAPEVKLIPEILDPVRAVKVKRRPTATPQLIWVGQDIPRKNLPLALELFSRIRSHGFPDATLEIFGCDADGIAQAGVTFHGWVNAIDWPSFSDSGILLLTSYREGLPSVVLEAIQNGLLCITADVGAIGGLAVSTVLTLPRDEYPAYSARTIERICDRIKLHLDTGDIELQPVSYRTMLSQYLGSQGVMHDRA